MSRNLFAKPIYKVQINGSIGWSDLKERIISYQTVEFASRKEAEKAAKELNPGEYTQGRIRVVPVELSEDYDVYPVVERVNEKPKI
jgi:RNA recognition motif-containing protein